ncbi:hypothetical protein D3C72_902630 [compost metagenome]
MARRVEHLIHRPQLHDFAQIHHHDAVRDVAHHVQVVADEHIGQPEVVLQVQQQVEHLRLDRLVQGGHRFVQDHQPGVQGQRARDVHALALAARQFVRVAAGKALRVQAHAAQQPARHRDGVALGAAMHQRAKGHGVFDGHARVQRRIAVLEHHLCLATEFAQRQRARAHRHAVEHQFALVLFDQLHDQPRGGGLAAARFPHHAQRLALLHVEVHAVHRAHRVAAPAARERIALERKMLDQAAHAQQGLGGAAHVFVRHAHHVDDGIHSLTSMAERSPSDSRLKDIDVMKIITPGSAATQGWV